MATETFDASRTAAVTIASRGTRRRHMLLLVATALVVTAVATPAASATTKSQLHFRKPVALVDGRARTEPSLVVDPAGRIYVSAIFGAPGRIGGNPTDPAQAPGTPVWRSTDGGRTYSEHATCSAGPFTSNLSGADSALVLDKRNYLYGTDLWIGEDSGWFSTNYGTSCLGTPGSHRPIDDRNWLAYSAKDDAIYQVFDGVDGLWVARADLNTPAGPDTSLFDAVNVQIAPEDAAGRGNDTPYVRDNVAPPGGLAVDQRSGAVYATWPDQHGVAVAKSADKGLSWSLTHIPGTSVTGHTSDDQWNFTPVATDARGTVYVAWCQVVGTAASPRGINLWLGWSTNGGASWQKTRIAARTTAVLPALAVSAPGQVAVGWVDSGARGDPNGPRFEGQRWRLQLAVVQHLLAGKRRVLSGTIDPDVHENTLFVGPQGGDRGMGDFFSIAATRAGGLVVAYSRGQDGAHGTAQTEQVMVSVLPSIPR